MNEWMDGWVDRWNIILAVNNNVTEVCLMRREVVVSRIMPLPQIHILISTTYDYASLYGKTTFADGIKFRILRRGKFFYIIWVGLM